MSENHNNPKRRGRKPRGGIANLSDILAFQQQPIAPSSLSSPSMHANVIVDVEEEKTWRSSNEVGRRSETEPPQHQQQVHHHTLDFDLAHWNQHSTTPHAMQIHNFTSKSNPTSSTNNPKNPSTANQKVDPDQIADEDLDELDLFPNDEPIDFEVIFKTQTAASASRGLHMSQRDRDNLEVYRPTSSSDPTMSMTMNESSNPNAAFVQIPEHMRIVSLPVMTSTPDVDMNSSSLTTSESAASSDGRRGATTAESLPLPDFFHPFRIHTYSPAVHAHQPSHALEDNISWPSRSPFACWWCRHTFETYPKVAPVWIRGDEVEVIGNFCTWNCSKAYCMKEFRRLDLFNTFYHKLFQAHANEVVAAPSFLTIDTFGGPMTIQSFRSRLNNPERPLQFDMFAHTHIRVSKMFISK